MIKDDKMVNSFNEIGNRGIELEIDLIKAMIVGTFGVIGLLL